MLCVARRAVTGLMFEWRGAHEARAQQLGLDRRGHARLQPRPGARPAREGAHAVVRLRRRDRAEIELSLLLLHLPSVCVRACVCECVRVCVCV